MSLFIFLTVLQAIIGAALVGVILIQRSEGGGLGVGGSPSGLMSARGAADFLTRLTTILATLFVGLSIALAVIAASGHTSKIDASQATQAPESSTVPASQPATAPQNPAAPAPAPASNGAVPLQQ